VDALAKDAMACLALLTDRPSPRRWPKPGSSWPRWWARISRRARGGVLRIARRVAPDRIISTVDPEARHGHKTNARGFDGYKAHAAVDPDSEIITATAITRANVGDAAVAGELLADCLRTGDAPSSPAETEALEPVLEGPGEEWDPPEGREAVAVYGASAYGSGELLATLERAGATTMVKVQAPNAPAGHFPKDPFVIDLHAQTVTCPGEVTVPIRPSKAAAGRPGSGGPARAAPLLSPAPPRRGAGSSRSGPTRANSPGVGSASATRHGPRTTEPRGRGSNGRSRTSCADATGTSGEGPRPAQSGSGLLAPGRCDEPGAPRRARSERRASRSVAGGCVIRVPDTPPP
jgi:hypothetical protein